MRANQLDHNLIQIDRHFCRALRVAANSIIALMNNGWIPLVITKQWPDGTSGVDAITVARAMVVRGNEVSFWQEYQMAEEGGRQ